MPKGKSDVEKKGVSKVRQYSIGYLKYGFTEECGNESKPFCLLCSSSLCNDSMRPGKLAEHLKRVHPEHAGRSLDYFIPLKENTQKTKRSFINLFKVHDDKKEQLLKASYELSFLIAKNLDHTQMASSY